MRCIISLNVQCCSLLFSTWIKIGCTTVQLPLTGNLSLPLFNKPSLEGSTAAFSKQVLVTFIKGKCKISVSQALKIKQPNLSKRQNKAQPSSLCKCPVGLCVLCLCECPSQGLGAEGCSVEPELGWAGPQGCRKGWQKGSGV